MPHASCWCRADWHVLLHAALQACLPLAAALHHLLEGPEEADAQVPALLAAADASTAAASLSALPHQMFSIWMEQPSDECLRWVLPTLLASGLCSRPHEDICCGHTVR